MPYIPPSRGSFVPRRNPVQKIPNLSLGLMDRQNPIEIHPLSMADCENVSVDEGTIKSSPGWITMTPTQSLAGPFYAIYQFIQSDGTNRVLRMRQNNLEYSNSSFFNWVFNSCTLPGGFSFTNGEYPTFATLDDTVIISNGVDSALQSTDGITWSLATYGSPANSVPKSKYVINDGRNRLLYAGQPSNPSQVSWTSINSPTTIAGSQLINPNDNEAIIGIGITPLGSVLIFKENSIYEMGDITGGASTIQKVAGNVSLANHNTIITTEDSIIFMGYDGVYEYIGGVVRYLFGDIKKKGRNFVLGNKYFCAGYYNRKYYLSIPDNTVSQNYNAQEYVIDKNLQGPSMHQPYAVTRNKRYVGCYGFEDVTGDVGTNLRAISLYFGDSRTPSGSPATGGTDFGYINSYELTESEGYTQGLNGSAQSCFFETKFFTNEEFFYEKKYKKFYFACKAKENVTFTIAYRFDPYEPFQETNQEVVSAALDWTFESGETGGWTFESGETGGWGLSSIKHNFIDIENSADVPRGIQFKISWSSVNPVEIIDLGFMFRPKNKFK